MENEDLFGRISTNNNILDFIPVFSYIAEKTLIFALNFFVCLIAVVSDSATFRLYNYQAPLSSWDFPGNTEFSRDLPARIGTVSSAW